jgi:AcrR family transcriptional regulator
MNFALNEHIATTDDLKRQRILESATGVFLSYGFQRTTMDDIARAAEMSRPALYLLFRNKTDIYRAIAQQVFAAALASADRAFSTDRPLAERLEAMLEDAVYAMLARFQNSPHGAEVMDAKVNLAGDLVEEWVRGMIDMLEAALNREAQAGAIDLAARGYTARGLAELFWDAVEGAKTRVSDIDSQRRSTRMIIRLIAEAVAPRQR